MAIFEVKSNIKLDGVLYKIGQCIEAEVHVLEQSVSRGIVKLIAEAKTIEEGLKISKENATAVADALVKKQVNAPANTFGPKPDEVKTSAPAEKEEETELKGEVTAETLAAEKEAEEHKAPVGADTEIKEDEKVD